MTCSSLNDILRRAYSQSKLANILFTRELAERLKGSGVTVNCLHPGIVNTGFGIDRQNGKRFGIGWLNSLGISPERGAETIVYLACSPDADGVTGEYWVKKRIAPVSREARNREKGKALWELSEKMTGIGQIE